MPTALPSFFHSSKITITPLDVVGVSSAPQTLVEQVYEFPGKRWEATIEIPKYKRRHAEQIIGFLLSLNGSAGMFYLGDTANKLPGGLATGAPVCNGAQVRGGNLLATRGWTASKTGILFAGDWIQVNNASGQRLYKVTADADSDAGGNSTLSVWPRLRDASPDGTALVTNTPQGIFYLSANSPWDINTDRTYNLAVHAIESIFP